MAISRRLKTIAEFVTPGSRAADIGTDHGYVPICLLRKGISAYAIAADLSPDSLEKARENISRAGLLYSGSHDSAFPEDGEKSGIECRLSDGLTAILPGEIDSIIISGMGGILMDRILREGMEVVLGARELILSPHRDVRLIREFASEFDFPVLCDLEIEDKKKKYAILKLAVSGENSVCKFGTKCLI